MAQALGHGPLQDRADGALVGLDGGSHGARGSGEPRGLPSSPLAHTQRGLVPFLRSQCDTSSHSLSKLHGNPANTRRLPPQGSTELSTGSSLVPDPSRLASLLSLPQLPAHRRDLSGGGLAGTPQGHGSVWRQMVGQLTNSQGPKQRGTETGQGQTMGTRCRAVTWQLCAGQLGSGGPGSDDLAPPWGNGERIQQKLTS